MMHGPEKSDPVIVAGKPANKAEQPPAERSAGEPNAAEPVERRAGTKGNAGQQSTCRTQRRANVSQELERIRQAARERRKERFTALFHHLSIELLAEAFFELKKDAAPGVDRLTWTAYEADLEQNLEDLHGRVHRGAYRALPSRRVYIPKPDGRQRPLAVAALEDKIVQRAVVALLNAIYEEDFLGISYGFRPGRGTHDALDALCVGIDSRKVSWILDADIQSFFDTVNQEWLIRFVEHRIGDRRIIRLIRKWLKAGVLEDGIVTVSDRGTGQGAVISPLLANIYLHYALDLWAVRWRRREATGDMIIVRYADDFIIGFQHESDGRRFLDGMRERLGKFALTLHPEKTRLIEFGRFAAERRQRRGLGRPETFNFLGFTFICGKTRQIPDQKEDPARSHAGEVADDQRGAVAVHAPAPPRSGEMAVARRSWLLQLSRSADQRPCTGRVPAPCRRPLAAHAAASQPQGLHHVGTDDAAGGGLAPETDHPSSLAELSLRRHTPKVGAVCGKAARTVLCGGRAMKRTSLPLQRRAFITLLGGAAAAWPLAARAQQTEQTRRIGVLMAYAEGDREARAWIAAFRQELQKFGWTEDRSIRIEIRWATTDEALLQRFAKELIALQPDLILSSSTLSTAALLRQTRIIPIVFATVADPVGDGFVASFPRPSGNATGFTTVEASMAGKWLELLKEIAPRTARVASIFHPTSTAGSGSYLLDALNTAAAVLAVEVISAPVHDMSELEAAVSAQAREPNGGLIWTVTMWSNLLRR